MARNGARMALLNAQLLAHLHKRSAPLVRTLADRAALLRAAEIVGQYDASTPDAAERLVPALLDAIEPMLAAKGAIVRGYGASWLWQLAAKHVAAADFLRKSMASRHARARLIIVQYAGCSPEASPVNTGLVKEVLRAGLRDKSRSVRGFSADRIAGRLYFDLLEDLERALKAERHPKARSSMEYNRESLVHGYTISPEVHGQDKDKVNVWVRVRGASTGLSVSKDLMAQIGLPELARRVRARHHDRTIAGDRLDPLPPGYEHAGEWPASVLPAGHTNV